MSHLKKPGAIELIINKLVWNTNQWLGGQIGTCSTRE